MANKSITRGIKWLVVLAVIGGASYYGYTRFVNTKQKPPEYRTATIGRGEITQMVTANGALSPMTNITVGSQVSGIITDLRVDFNTKVTNGQVIAQIDPSTYQRMVVQATAQRDNSKASLELAQVEYRRSKELFEAKLISASDYDKALATMHQAEASLQMSEASLEKSKVDLGYTTITAPLDGMVISRSVEVGQTVASSFSTPTLFQIANDLRQMRIEAMVSEADVGGVKEGQPVEFTVEAYLGQNFSGEVSQVRFAPVTNQNVVTYSVIVRVNNDDLRLRPGMTANASIITSRKSGVTRIANSALRFRPPDNAIVLSNALAQATPGKDSAPTVTAANAQPRGSEGRGEMDSERRKRFESMSPEEREKFRARMQERGGMGMLGGGRGGNSPKPDAITTQTVYLVDKQEGTGVAQLKPVSVKIGVTDGAYSEVIEGLKEGDVVATGTTTATTGTTAATSGSSPFGSPFGGPPRR
jgi:HlyD family secretion protein